MNTLTFRLGALAIAAALGVVLSSAAHGEEPAAAAPAGGTPAAVAAGAAGGAGGASPAPAGGFHGGGSDAEAAAAADGDGDGDGGGDSDGHGDAEPVAAGQPQGGDAADAGLAAGPDEREAGAPPNAAPAAAGGGAIAQDSGAGAAPAGAGGADGAAGAGAATGAGTATRAGEAAGAASEPGAGAGAGGALAGSPAVEKGAGDLTIRLGLNEGFVLEGQDRRVLLHLGGLAALDYREYDDRNVRDSGFRLDRALLLADGQPVENLFFKIYGDLRGTDTRFGLYEAWVSYMVASAFRVSGGLLRMPLTIEHSLPEYDLPFVDYSFPAYLTGRHDWGLRLDGELGAGILSYAAFFGAGEGYDLTGQRRGDAQVAGRLMSYPFRWIDFAFGPDWYRVPLPSGFFVSGSYAWRFSYEGQLDVQNSFRNRLFRTPRLEGDEARGWAIGYGIDAGPFRVIHEWTRNGIYELELPGGGTDDFEGQITAWTLMVSWMVTGEPYDTRLLRQPWPGVPRDGRGRGEFPRRALGAGGFGAVELAFRYSNGDIDRSLILAGFTSETESSQEFRTIEAAVNWYPIHAVRLGGQVTRTLADGRPSDFDSHGRDTSFLFRVQLFF